METSVALQVVAKTPDSSIILAALNNVRDLSALTPVVGYNYETDAWFPPSLLGSVLRFAVLDVKRYPETLDIPKELADGLVEFTTRRLTSPRNSKSK